MTVQPLTGDDPIGRLKTLMTRLSGLANLTLHGEGKAEVASDIAFLFGRLETLERGLSRIKSELLIPAAEYVPAIPAVWDIIDALLASHLLAEIEQARGEGWRTDMEKPEPGRKIAATWHDGSGGGVFYVVNGEAELLDADGDELSWESLDGCIWTYLPDKFKLWCENREDPLTLPSPPSGGSEK